MLNFRGILAHKLYRNILIIVSGLGLVYLLLRITIFTSDPIIPLVSSLLDLYLYVPEWIANLIFKATHAGVTLENHHFIFIICTSRRFTFGKISS